MKLQKYIFIILMLFIIMAVLLFPTLLRHGSKNEILDIQDSIFPQIEESKIYHEEIDDKINPKIESMETSFLFFGDIMPGRNVEALSKENSDYPFLNIKDLLTEKNDIVFGNLEGPIDKNHIMTKSGSVSFSLPGYTAEILKNNGFNLLQLANNHLQDRGSYGFINTQDILKASEIDFFGDYYNRYEYLSFEKNINNKNFIFLGFNMINLECEKDSKLCIEKINNDVKKLIENKDDYFKILFIHWGNEYKLTSNYIQKELAHKLIDSGIDLIIGGHPHVTQEIEKYNNKLIFYSLGNFIFDQYFSKDTQQGFALKFKIINMNGNEKLEFNLIPLQSIKSQPQKMDKDTETEFLKMLSDNSSEDIKNNILDKKILIEK